MDNFDAALLEWFVYFQTFHCIGTEFIKEFCAINVQTRHVHLYHIIGPKECWLQPCEQKVFKAQMLRHGLQYNTGTMNFAEFRQRLKQDIDAAAEIYVAGLLAIKTMESMGYRNANMLPPITDWKKVDKFPNVRCLHHKDLPHFTCALKICWEMFNFCMPAFVPHFNIDLIEMHPKPIDAMFKYGEHSLQAPFYKKLSTVDLLAIAYPKPNGNCEYSVAGELGKEIQAAQGSETSTET